MEVCGQILVDVLAILQSRPSERQDIYVELWSVAYEVAPVAADMHVSDIEELGGVEKAENHDEDLWRELGMDGKERVMFSPLFHLHGHTWVDVVEWKLTDVGHIGYTPVRACCKSDMPVRLSDHSQHVVIELRTPLGRCCLGV